MATNYERGRNFEYRVKKQYEKEGHFVLRSAGSKTPVDLLVVSPLGEPIFVQCKNSARISKKEKAKFAKHCDKYNCKGFVEGKTKKGHIKILWSTAWGLSK